MSKKSKRQRTETFTNSTCRDLGHDWTGTAADNFRRCKRTHCRATQRLHGTEWVSTQQERPWIDPRIAWTRRQQQPRQVSLFS